MTRVLLLWDVDDTLIAGGGVNEEIYRLAYALLTGRPPETEFSIAGYTERGLLDRMLTVNGLDPAGVPVAGPARGARRGLRAPPGLAAPPRRVSCPACRPPWRRPRAGPRSSQSLLTGNCVENARTKLGRVRPGLAVDLEVGGYGSDALVRGELVAIAQAKAAEQVRRRPGARRDGARRGHARWTSRPA